MNNFNFTISKIVLVKVARQITGIHHPVPCPDVTEAVRSRKHCLSTGHRSPARARALRVWRHRAQPRIHHFNKAVEIVRQIRLIRLLLAVVARSLTEQNSSPRQRLSGRRSWDIVGRSGTQSQKVLPVGTVLTLPATSSEMNNKGVISYREKGAKSFTSDKVFKSFPSWIPKRHTLYHKQVRNGLVDTYIHP